ncbi:Ig-like domain repeat protein [Ramlibacter sp. USB13]|uniref:Ig-like domain repeat protein n=1 Tax=Ramlibacter cellulosilyticus TaxID=2764187 RepID=A0A923SCN6_9BURK|nr:Ig-like domain repeat protein [Ramlibacter cellulosilyticus]MBC5785079.1 Ig-like domain repeat protein [Ramlibacter cellulosilyticus]
MNLHQCTPGASRWGWAARAVVFVAFALTSAVSQAQTASVTVLTSTPSASTAGQSVTLTATVTGSNPTGVVTFTDGAATLGAKPLASGSVTLSVKLPGGSHALTAVYAGDAANTASTSSTLTHVVSAAASTTTLSVTPSGAAIGQNVTLMAKVAGYNPSGAVTFTAGGTPIGTAPVTGGAATLSTAGLGPGSHVLSASYAGDASNATSTSATVSVTVSARPSMTWQYGYDAVGRPNTVVDPNGLATYFYYDALGRRIQTQQPPNTGSSTPTVTQFGYDAIDSLTSFTDPRSLTTSYTPNGLGTVGSQSSPDSGASQFTHDAKGNVLTSTDARGKTTTFSYDALDRVRSITYASGTPTTFEYDGGTNPYPGATGELTKMTDESGQTTYSYDSMGRLTGKTVVIAGKTFTVGYTWGDSGSALDKITAITYPSGTRVNYGYEPPDFQGADFDGDGISDLLWYNETTGSSAIWRGANESQASPVDSVADLNWKIAAVADFNGDGSFDVLWRNTATGDNVIWRSGKSALAQAVVSVLDASWKVAGVGDFDGDRKADILWRNEASGQNVIWASADVNQTRAVESADVNWRVATLGDFDGDGKSDILWRNQVSGANAIWRSGKVEQAQAVAAVADMMWKVAGAGDFDADGISDILWHNDSTGANIIWRHGDAAQSYALSPTAANLKAAAIGDFNGDGRSDILWRDVTAGANVIWNGGDSSASRAVTAVPDLNWQLPAQTSTGGSGKAGSLAMSASYAKGSITSITVNSVNPNGQGASNAKRLLLSGIGYNVEGNVAGWLWSDGKPRTIGYDDNGLVSSYTLGDPLGTGSTAGLLRSVHRDAAGRITGYTHTNNGAAQASFDQGFGYDNLDRLTTATRAATTTQYSYDATGNRTAKTIGGTTYTNTVSATSNRLTQVQDATGTASIGHDAAGNIVGDGSSTFAYSDRGRMASATTGSGTVAYLYNGDGLRVKKSGPTSLVTSGASHFVYDEQGQLLGEYDANGTPLYETIYLGTTPVGVLKQTGTAANSDLAVTPYNVHADHLDTPRVITKQDHTIVWRWDAAEAFGATAPDQNPSGLGAFAYNQRFPGQVFDSETGLFQNWNRDYDARIGRYRQSDPIGLAGGINTFSYVEASPLSAIDPHGLQSPFKQNPAANPLLGFGGGGGGPAPASGAGAGGTSGRAVPLPRWNPGPGEFKPVYKPHPDRVKGPRYNPDKTPEPKDCPQVFARAVPEDPVDPRQWWGKSENGLYYKFHNSNDGTAHFSGSYAPTDPKVPGYVRDRLGKL